MHILDGCLPFLGFDESKDVCAFHPSMSSCFSRQAMLPKSVFPVCQYMESGMMLKVAMNLHKTEIMLT
jgi:hypothetical protein